MNILTKFLWLLVNFLSLSFYFMHRIYIYIHYIYIYTIIFCICFFVNTIFLSYLNDFPLYLLLLGKCKQHHLWLFETFQKNLRGFPAKRILLFFEIIFKRKHIWLTFGKTDICNISIFKDDIFKIIFIHFSCLSSYV